MTRHPNRVGGIRNNYMTRWKYARRANPYKKRSGRFRERVCWFCIPGNRQGFLQRLEAWGD